MCTGAFPPEARQTSAHKFHLSCGAGANIEGLGSSGWTIHLAQASACVEKHLAVWCWLSAA